MPTVAIMKRPRHERAEFGTPQIVRLSLIDFYLIEREDIELSGNTVFLGPNRSGKSSCIDAIQTGLTGGAGDLVVYNAAAVRQNRPDAHRSLQEYCLGVVRHDENEKAKVVRKSSQTWIGLSFRTREGGEVAGVVHVVAHEHRERPNTRFMIVTGGGVTTADLVFSTDEGEMTKGFDQAVDGLRASGRKVEECDSASDYSTYLLNLLTYGSWHADAHSYYKAVKRALVFQPVGDITAFMRTHVLETEIIDIGRMRANVSAFYREIVRTIDSTNRQITSLGIVVGHYSKAAEDDREARGRVAAATEAAVTQRQSEIDAIEKKLVGLRTKVDVAVEEEKKADERKKSRPARRGGAQLRRHSSAGNQHPTCRAGFFRRRVEDARRSQGAQAPRRSDRCDPHGRGLHEGRREPQRPTSCGRRRRLPPGSGRRRDRIDGFRCRAIATGRRRGRSERGPRTQPRPQRRGGPRGSNQPGREDLAGGRARRPSTRRC